jgi:carbon dioxide concentrating mechanism protein CcmN
MNLENLKIMQSNYLPPLEPIGDFRSYVCGDVVIDETAAIASGVLIQADQGGKITIGAGVCIGMGAVLHAQGGLLEIAAGANLGAGVLVYGTSRIGEGACIGASSSIVRAVIAKGAIVPPCSLISGLEQTAVEKEASPAIAQDLETSLETNKIPSPTNNYSFTHTYSAAQPLKNKFVSANFAQSPVSLDQSDSLNSDNIIERSTTETYVRTSVTATPESVIANSVERTVTETQVEIPNEPIIEQSSELPEIAENTSEQEPSNAINPEQTGSDLTLMNAANSSQAKAYAQSQINRYIKRLFPQN